MSNTNSVFDVISTQKPKSEQTGPTVTKISTKRLGDLAEQWVSLLLSWKGAEVFPNANSTGAADLVFILDGRAVQIDVKVSTYLPETDYWHAKNCWAVKAPQYAVVVEPDGDITNWRVRWYKSCPEGMENLWNNSNQITTTK